MDLMWVIWKHANIWYQGVTTAVSQPQVGSDLLAGVSVAFRTGVENTVLDTVYALVKEEAALNFVIDHSGKS